MTPRERESRAAASARAAASPASRLVVQLVHRAAVVTSFALATVLVVSAQSALRAVAQVSVAQASVAQASVAPTAAVPTYSRDIAPILFSRCSSCHHPGGPAPFSVLSYAAVRPFARQIGDATARGLMPPWKADPPLDGGFLGQPQLSATDKALIARWVDGGAPAGDAAALPPLPQIREGWAQGAPDLIVNTPTYRLSAEGTDVFRIFVIPLPGDRPRTVRGLEFRPGNARVVHHANIRIDTTRASRRFDDADPLPGYEGLIAHSATYPDGYFLGWTPGQVSPLLPKGLGWSLSPGTDLVVELHMQPSGKAEDVTAAVGVYFTDDPPTRTPAMLRLGRQSIDIPAGASRYTIADEYVLPVDVEVQAAQPHAHLRAREVTGVATLPDGTTRPVLHVRDWDFRWQHVYRFERPLSLPKGTKLSMQWVYDNSAENPRNPVQPPRRVFWGQRSADEMGDLWLQVLTTSDADLRLLNDQFGLKVAAEDVIGYERWIQSEPTSAALHDDVGVLYLRLGRPLDAVRHFGISAAFQPSVAAAHFNLGVALTMAGELPTAAQEYRKALALNPAHGPSHNNLGSVLLRAGQIAEALPHLQEAVRLDPANAQAQFNLGAAWDVQGKSAEAAAAYRRAVTLDSAHVSALVNLTWLLAASRSSSVRDAALAVRLGERAVELTQRRDASALDALGAAYAAGGYYSKAAEAAGAALALSPSDAGAIVARRVRYERLEPFEFTDR